MIISAPDWLQDFIAFLNSKALTSEPCLINFVPHFGKAELSEAMGTECVAMYEQDPRLMIVAGNLAEVGTTEFDARQLIMQNVAHEYVHHLQNVEGRLPRQEHATEEQANAIEEEAEGRSLQLVIEYFAEKGTQLCFSPNSERSRRIFERYGIPIAGEVEGFITGQVECAECGHRWICVRPGDCPDSDLECPACTDRKACHA